MVGPGRRDFEFCPRSVADSWRHLSRRNPEPAPDALPGVFLFEVPCPHPTTRDPWRSHARLVTVFRRKNRRCARAAGRGTAPYMTARPAGCGIPMRLAGASIWPSNNGEWPVRTVRGRRWSGSTGWPGIRAIRNALPTRSGPCVGTCRTRRWQSCCTCMSTRSRTWTPSTCRPGWPRRRSRLTGHRRR